MVFCLCGRRCFSRTLVINQDVKLKKKHEDRRPTYYQIQQNGLQSKNKTGISIISEMHQNDNKINNISDDSTSVNVNVTSEEETEFKHVTKKPKAPQRPDSVIVFDGTGSILKPKSKSVENLYDMKENELLHNPKAQSEENIYDENTHTITFKDKSKNKYNEDAETTKPVQDQSKNKYNEDAETRKPVQDQSKNKYNEDVETTKPVQDQSENKYNEDVETTKPVQDQSKNKYNENTKTTKPVQVQPEKDIYNEDTQSTDIPKLSIDMELGVRERREGVAPVPTRINENMEKLPVYNKDPKDEELIKKAIENNDFLNQIIASEQLKDVVAAMYNKEILSKEVIIKQGDKGSHMYVSAKGTYQITVNGKVVSEFKDIRVFGEVAIMYNAKRQATIKAITSGRLWVLDRSVYQQIMISHNIRKQDELMNFLVKNEILKVVGNEALQIVTNLLKSEFFKSDQTIVRQGDRGDKFYIIRAGTVTITKDGEGIVGVYKKGDCFGELALLEEDCRQATVTANAPGVECLTLTRKEFIDHLGEIKKFKYIKVKDQPKESIRSVTAEHEDINLTDLRIIKTLGVGGFGRVELVQHLKEEKLVFALKYLKKIEIVQQNQQEHVYNEKIIQMTCRSPFIVRLYRTYKDTKYVYFLMESCLGGDLWSLLQKQKNRRFEEKEARFICACVIEAFEYLHSRGVIYRDLKPENLLVASNGYVKLTDFGFAKKILNRGKTYTFAGTPEYVAPEIVLNRGHDRAVDYWAFGAFVFEMLSGRTPFRTDDSSHMRTYNKILSGIDNVNFPTYINLKARHLIEKLCRPVPSERLGMQRRGIQDIKGHKWFLGMEFQKMARGEHSSPFRPKLTGPIDTRYFDQFKRDIDNPPEELSGWDENF